MKHKIHITSGDHAGQLLQEAKLAGEILVWHDILYDGPRNPGWPSEASLQARAIFLEQSTDGGLDQAYVLETLQEQYRKLSEMPADTQTVLWFDACLFDQSMLCHILTCLQHLKRSQVDLICIDAHPRIERYNGLGQLQPSELAASYPIRQPVSPAQFEFACTVDRAFAEQDLTTFRALAAQSQAPLEWVPAAITRWLEEQSYAGTEFGRLEHHALAALRAGCHSPAEIFAAVAQADTPPQYWGDTALWAKINGLAARTAPLVRIEGPSPRLPQWQSKHPLAEYRVYLAD
ncbi:MAG: hypothetical protein CML13_16095 [Puniceicoccaceae bacterium]|nr:hypothetical protein [Puniceicoccaceae bacterium]